MKVNDFEILLFLCHVLSLAGSKVGNLCANKKMKKQRIIIGTGGSRNNPIYRNNLSL